jgi:hypothetical protein
VELLLCEQTLLIALDDERGRDTSQWGSDAGLAGALLLDLADRGLIDVDGNGKVVALDGPATGAPLLDEAHAAIRDDDKRRNARGWVQRLPRALKPLRDRVAHGLVERGILTEEHSKLLGLVPRTRYPTADPAPERELRARLEAVLLDGQDPTAREALLIGLLEPLELIGGLVPRDRRRDARKRAKQVAEQGIAGTAVRDAVRAVQAAVMAAVVAATTASTAAST